MDVGKPSFPFEQYTVELQALLVCNHELAEPRRKLKARTGHPYYRLQCVKCGKAMSLHLPRAVVLAFEAGGNVVKDWDEKLNEQYRQDRAQHAAPLRKRYNAERDRIGRERYRQYLKSPEWYALRERVFVRDKYTCQICYSKRSQEAHHLTYDRIGRELDSDLIAVCAGCYEVLHEE